VQNIATDVKRNTGWHRLHADTTASAMHQGGYCTVKVTLAL
jgi:hypothetical protein